jgi:YtkA-like protein
MPGSGEISTVRGVIRRALFILASLCLLLGAATPALAHGLSGEADLALAQTIAGNELTVVVRRTDQVPGPVRVDVITHRPVRATVVRLGLRAAAGGEGSTAAITLVAGRAGTYAATLRAERTGPHLLELRAGGETSRLPFQLLVPRASGSELLGYGAFGAASVLLIGALTSGALARRLPAVAFGGAAVVAATVGLTAALLAPQLNPVSPPARPYAQLNLATSPIPKAGAPFTLRLSLLDGATGYPVDDLVPNHGALTHLVVTSADGGYFRHVHPIRTRAGQWEVRLTADRPGRHLVYLELERADSGGQLVSGSFTVTGEAQAAKPVAARHLRATTGRATPIDVDVGTGVQPWLGMAGHLIVRDQSGGFLGHVHEQLSMRPDTQPPDETVAAYGPTLRFAFGFPKPGRYFAWVQYVRDFEVVTVPYVVDVRAGPAEPEPVGDTGRTYVVQVGFDDARRRATIQVEPDARTVDVSAVMPGMGHATSPVAARKLAPGRFEARAEFFGMPGKWELSVRVTGAAGAEIVTIPVTVDK